MAFSFSPKIVTDGLVLALDAANTRSYVSGSTVWNDLTANGNIGTLVNGPTYSSANAGIIQFDGVDDYVKLGSGSIYISGSAVTVEAWVKTNVTNQYKKIFVINPPGTQTISQSVYLSIGPNNQNLYFGAKTSNSQVAATYTTNISTTEYSNICGTYDGANIRLYLNGRQVASSLLTGTIGAEGIARLSGYDNNTEIWNGNIATFKIYNKALSPTEVLQNYNATKSRFNLT